jgi:glycosyltransferase involved in cell wall biosynthesis
VTPWLIVTGDLTPLGGMDCANHALARYLAGRGDVDLHLVAHRVWPDLEAAGAHVHRVSRPMGRHAAGQPLLARAGRRWARTVAARGGRVVVNGGNCLWSDANWVHFVHAAYPEDASRSALRRMQHRLEARRERRALAAARIVIANSERTRADLVERVAVPAERIRVVYYGSDPERFSAVTADMRARARAALGWPADRPVATFIGALGDHRKGFDVLFAAWTRLCRDPSWDADLGVAGSGRELAAWRARAREAGLGGRIHFLGFRNDVPEVIAASDLLVHPARYEAYGLAAHEAICREVPALVSASAGIAERYPAALDALRLRDPNDEAELEARLRAWHRDRAAVRAAVAPLARRFRSRTWDHMAADLVAALEPAV